MKKIISLILSLSLLFLSGCEHNKGAVAEESYLDIKEGENFGGNVDGYQKKLPYNFCLDVDLSEKARLFKVPDNLLNKPYFLHSVYNTPAMLEGRFIKGYYDSTELVLCEEVALGKLEYTVFDFKTQKTKITNDEKEIAQKVQGKWFFLCNTIEESEKK